jgi:hypothetical protein
MKINLRTGWLAGFTGSELWTYTMAKYLSRKHEVRVTTAHPGKLAELIDFCSVGSTLPSDLAIVNHRPMVVTDTPMIYTCHSVIHEVERFPDVPCIKAAPSEEIKAGRDDVHVIYQPIDFEKFMPTRRISRTPKTILYLCNPNYAEARPIVQEAFKGFELIFIDEPVFEIEKLIDRADVVVSLGRGCYEALVMGRNVISGDKRSYMADFAGGGMITEDNFEHLLKTNLSSRDNLIHFTAESLRAELEKYDPDRQIDMSRFEASLIADQYGLLSGAL